MSTPSGSRPSRGANEPNPLTRLLAARLDGDSSDHGTFTSSDDETRPGTPVASVSSGPEVRMGGGILLKRKTTTARMAQEAGVTRPWLMYASYYIPSIGWMGTYQWSYLVGDVVAGSEFALATACRRLGLTGRSHYGIVLYPHGTLALGEFGTSPAHPRPLRVRYPTSGTLPGLFSARGLD